MILFGSFKGFNRFISSRVAMSFLPFVLMQTSSHLKSTGKVSADLASAILIYICLVFMAGTLYHTLSIHQAFTVISYSTNRPLPIPQREFGTSMHVIDASLKFQWGGTLYRVQQIAPDQHIRHVAGACKA